MLYYQPYALPADETLVAAWDSELARLSEFPEFAAEVHPGMFLRFATHYERILSLPRGARRALGRRLAGSSRYGAPAARKLARTAAGVALLLALAQGAEAATINVTTNQPGIQADGKCSLIEAIINANDDAATHPDCAAGGGADTIVLPKKKSHVLTSSYVDFYGATGLPVIRSAITIEGNGATITRGKHAEAFRIFAVDAGVPGPTFGNLTLNNVTVSGGSTSENGGGIYARGLLTLNNAVVAGNTAAYGGGIFGVFAGVNVNNSTISGNTANGGDFGAFGGGIEGSLAPITVVDSTVSGNRAVGDAGQFASGGGISTYLTLHVENSTISGNAAIGGSGAGAAGGGVSIRFGVNSSGFSIFSSTITGNTAQGGSGETGSGGGVATGQSGPYDLRGGFRDTIISGNSADTGPEVFGAVALDSYNVLGFGGDAGVVGFTPDATDIVPGVGLSQIIGPLKNNGGPTATHALVSGSPAIDAAPADSTCPAADQRGVTRPQGNACDIGSFEFTGKGKGKKNK
jgi:hypothetical protein